MSREALRIWVCDELPGVSTDEFDAIWSKLEDKGTLSEYDIGRMFKEDVLKEATYFAAVLSEVRLSWRDTSPYSQPERPDRGVPTEVSIELDAYTRRRAKTGSEVAAAFANKHPDVRRFRRAYLGGEDTRLTEEEAREFLEYPPTGEILDELLSLARRLGSRYRWTYQDTWRFLLTGDVPYIVPLRVHYNYVRDEPGSPEPHYPNMAEITLIVEPWVDVSHVERVFRDIQRQVRGGANRKNDERTLDAVRFVARSISRGGNETWEELTQRWNRAQTEPERRYKSRGALHQAFKRFVRVRYHQPVYKASEPEN